LRPINQLDNGTTGTIGSLLEQPGDGRSGQPAILGIGRGPLDRGGLAALVGSAAAELSARGIARGDRVALVVENGPEAATAFLSLAAAAACAPLNPSYRRQELDFFLADLGARAVVVSSTLDTPARDAARALGLQLIELEPVDGGPAGIFRLDGAAPAPGPIPERAPAEHALLLHTSGTTARPKLVPLTHANLTASARNVAATLELGPTDRCLNVMPLFHVHGLVASLLASLHAGGSVTCTPGFHPIHMLAWLEECAPTWYTAVPTMHQGLLARAPADNSIPTGRLRFIRSSSAALPRPVLEELERTFGVPVIEAYGMTEAAHQMASNPPTLAERRPGSVGRAAGPEIAILSPGGEELPPGALGEVAVRGSNVFAGYERNPEANLDAFTDGWFRTGDEGTLDVHGFLTLHGRIKELINRGGEKISPAEIDERLLSHPAVAEAVAFALPDPRLGDEVAAAVVLEPGRKATEPELQEFVAETLAPFKVPRRIVVVDAIPKGPTGKLQRIGLAERLELPTAARRSEPTEPRTAFEQGIARVFTQVLDLPTIGVDDDFFALGGDSILGSEAVARLRESTGQQLPLVSIVRSPTVRGMAAELDPVSALERSGPILLQAGPGPPIFFVHGGDGEVLQFVALARALDGSRAFYGIRARGIDDGEPPAASIEAMASDYVERIRSLQGSGPYALGGFCLGATVALEMARQLEAVGESASLFVVDPRLPRPNDARYLLWLARRRARDGRLREAAVGRLRGTTDAAGIEPGAPAIQLALARIREAYRAKPTGIPAVVVLGDQHERFSIPAWHVLRVLPNARTVRLPLSHGDLLRPAGATELAPELGNTWDAG
jgi:acyl-CoA synthetase (AMP-forming)/AMP-acid ligase II/surfactin synthase thioesterase subunit